MNVKNVLIVNDYNYSDGGSSKVAIDTANLLFENQLKVVFVCGVFKQNNELNSNIRVVTTNQHDLIHGQSKIKSFFSGIKNKEFTKTFKQLLEEFNADDTVVHVHGRTKCLSSDFFNICYKKGFKVFITLHDYFLVCPNGGLFNFNKVKACSLKPCSFSCCLTNCDSRSYLYKLYRLIRQIKYKHDIRMDKVYLIYISDFQKNIISKYYKTDNYAVIKNPFTLIKREKDFDYDFVFVGRGAKTKGVEMFIQMAKQLDNKKFLLIGPNINEEINNLTCTGWVDQDEVEKLLTKCKCLVLTSKRPEPFGLNAYRFAYSGLNLLVSSNTAATALVKDGENGYVFLQNDYHDLIDKGRKIDFLPHSVRYEANFFEKEYVNNLVKYFNVKK